MQERPAVQGQREHAFNYGKHEPAEQGPPPIPADEISSSTDGPHPPALFQYQNLREKEQSSDPSQQRAAKQGDQQETDQNPDRRREPGQESAKYTDGNRERHASDQHKSHEERPDQKHREHNSSPWERSRLSQRIPDGDGTSMVGLCDSPDQRSPRECAHHQEHDAVDKEHPELGGWRGRRSRPRKEGGKNDQKGRQASEGSKVLPVKLVSASKEAAKPDWG